MINWVQYYKRSIPSSFRNVYVKFLIKILNNKIDDPFNLSQINFNINNHNIKYKKSFYIPNYSLKYMYSFHINILFTQGNSVKDTIDFPM